MLLDITISKFTKKIIRVVFFNYSLRKAYSWTADPISRKARRRDYNKPVQGGLSPNKGHRVEGSSPLDSGLLFSSHGKTEQVASHYDHTYTCIMCASSLELVLALELDHITILVTSSTPNRSGLTRQPLTPRRFLLARVVGVWGRRLTRVEKLLEALLWENLTSICFL